MELSPDASRVAYSHETHIFIAPADGESPPVRLNTGGPAFCPKWSPSGDRIAFTTSRPLPGAEYAGMWQLDVRVTDLGTGSTRDVAASSEFEEFPTWAPNDRELAVVRGSAAVLVVDVETGKTRTVWNRPAHDWHRNRPMGAGWAPGRRIAVTTEPSGVWLIPSDGTGGDFVPGHPDGSWNAPVWSPQGDALAVLYRGPTDAPFRFVVLQPDGTRLLDQEGYGGAWSPDGRAVAVCSREGLRRMNRDGSDSVLVVQGWCGEVSW